MKCPLANYHLVKYEGEDTLEREDCLEEECAWWDRRNHRCIKVTESYDLSYIRAALEEIWDKMPHEKE